MKKRSVSACVLSAVAALTLAGCSAAESQPAVVACGILASEVASSAAGIDLSSITSDPAAVAAQSGLLAEGLSAAADKVSNTEVKKAASDLAATLAEVDAAWEKSGNNVLVMGAAPETQALTATLQERATAVSEVCSVSLF